MASRVGPPAGFAATVLTASLIVGIFMEIAADAARVAAKAQSKPDPEASYRKAGKSDLVIFGETPARNMVNSVDRNIPDKPDPENVKLLKWKVYLGSCSWVGTPTITGGRVFVGTNNNRPRNPRDFKKVPGEDPEPIDKGILMCFDKATGKFLWQAVHDKLPGGQVRDWPDIGVCSTPLVEGDRVNYVTNRCTIVVVEGSDGPLYADFHAIRHSFLTLGGRSGIDLRTLQELAGHSKPEQTARYSHRRLHDLTGAVGKLPGLVLHADTAPKVQSGVRMDVPKDVPTVCIDPHPVAQICSSVNREGGGEGIG